MDLELTEAQFQQRIVQYAQLRGWLVSHVESVTMAGKGGRVIRQTPAAKGYPDLTLARAGFVWFLEVKTEKGSPSADQVRWLNALSGLELEWRSRGVVPDCTPDPYSSGEPWPFFPHGVAVVRPSHWHWIMEVLR